jgi:hypothetical protein
MRKGATKGRRRSATEGVNGFFVLRALAESFGAAGSLIDLLLKQ